MGLRFRKSISLCKGVKLNFGKTGMSVSLGTKGYHKTISTTGRVTTTTGIPGTGIYYTDTKTLGGSNSRQNRSADRLGNISGLFERKTEASDSNMQRYDELVAMGSVYNDDVEFADIPEVTRSVDIKDDQPLNSGQRQFSELIDIKSDDIPWNYSDLEEKSEPNEHLSKMNFSEDNIKKLYRYCDPTVEWTEIIGGATADELLMDPDVWKFCKTIAFEILKGNIDAYLQAIEVLRPVDDLLLYSGDFEFGTDRANYIEVEFSHNAKDLLENGANDVNFEKLIFAISIRVARDLLALLPVSKVIVHVVDDNVTVLSGMYDRTTLNKYCNLEIDQLMLKIQYSIHKENGKLMEVDRLSIT